MKHFLTSQSNQNQNDDYILISTVLRSLILFDKSILYLLIQFKKCTYFQFLKVKKKTLKDFLSYLKII